MYKGCHHVECSAVYIVKIIVIHVLVCRSLFSVEYQEPLTTLLLIT